MGAPTLEQNANAPSATGSEPEPVPEGLLRKKQKRSDIDFDPEDVIDEEDVDIDVGDVVDGLALEDGDVENADREGQGQAQEQGDASLRLTTMSVDPAGLEEYAPEGDVDDVDDDEDEATETLYRVEKIHYEQNLDGDGDMANVNEMAKENEKAAINTRLSADAVPVEESFHVSSSRMLTSRKQDPAFISGPLKHSMPTA